MSDEYDQPPVPPDCDLRNCRRMPIDVVRLRGSELQVELTPEEKWYAFELWAAAFHQVPAASLPDHEAKLAYLAGLGRDKRTWKRVRAKVLRGWRRCATDGRLYHSTLAEICLEVWNSLRAKKRGAKLTNEKRWNRQASDNKGNASRSADRSIYNERHGKRAQSETQSETHSDTLTDRSSSRSAVATEGKDISFPHTPTLSSAGSGCADAPPARPAAAIPDSERVLVVLPTGAKLMVDGYANADEIWAPLDCPDTKLTPAQLLELRAQAIRSRSPPASPEAA